jgi:hypothetical protein
MAAANGVHSHPVGNGVAQSTFGGAGGEGGGFMQQQQQQRHHQQQQEHQQQGPQAHQQAPTSSPAVRQGAGGRGLGGAGGEAVEEGPDGTDRASDMDSDEEGEVPASPYHLGALG